MKPIALDAYEQLADAFAAQAETKPHNAYLDRPATLALLPEVRGMRVLDAGCGPGHYAEMLLDRGAKVVGIDVSPAMVRLAHERLGLRAEIVQADLSQPLSFLPDATFDLVIAPLVLNYLEDLRQPFAEFYRVLKIPGVFIFSEGHPFSDYRLCQRRGLSDDYFATELVGCNWTGFGTPVYVPWYRRPLSALINPLLDAGFHLDRILEPQPTEAFRTAEPEEYERRMREPTFMHIRAKKV